MWRDIVSGRASAASAWSRFACCALLCLLYLPSLVSAQTPVPANQPVTFAWDHPETADATHGAPTHYRVLFDGQEVAAKIPVGTRSYTHQGVPVGNHTAVVYAVNAYGQAASEELQFVAGLPPAAPSGLEIVVTTTATLRVEPNPDGTLAVHVVRMVADVSPATPITAPFISR